jgi:hypothetical protein
MKPPKANATQYKKFAKLAYEKNLNKVDAELKYDGYKLDRRYSNRETKVFYNPTTKKAVISYRGTALNDRNHWMKDLASDFHILEGREGSDRRFRESLKQFDRIQRAYRTRGFTVDTTGHSLGGQIATYVNKQRPGAVGENLSFSRGSGVYEPFRVRPHNTWDYSHFKDVISLGSRLSRTENHGDDGGGSFVDHTPFRSIASAHDIGSLRVQYPSP